MNLGLVDAPTPPMPTIPRSLDGHMARHQLSTYLLTYAAGIEPGPSGWEDRALTTTLHYYDIDKLFVPVGAQFIVANFQE